MSLIQKLADAQPSPDDVLNAELQRSKSKVAERQLKIALKAALNRIDEQDQTIGLLTALQERPPQEPGKAPKRTQNTATAILVLSDWHVEEPVLPSTVGGLNEFNLEIAEKRVNKVFERCLLLLEDARHLTRIDELVVAVLGDMASGRIHEELIETTLLAPMEAFMFAADLLERGIKTLLKHSGVKSIVIPTCNGNHGRTTHKMRHATAAVNSYEYFMYKSLARRFEKERKVRWQIGEGYHNMLEIQGRQFRFHHGDNVRYQGGVGGLHIPMNKAVAAWNKSATAYWDIAGHWHAWTDKWGNQGWLINGSLIGYSPFALSIKADYQRPVQSFLIVDRERGVTRALPVFCD